MDEGQTFLFPGDENDHLWMVVSDPRRNAGQVVIVRFLSFRDGLEETLILTSGEHPFVKHNTCVDYAAALLVSDTTLEELRKAKRLKLKQDLSPKLLADIREAASRSRIPLKCEKVLEDQGLLG